MEKTPAVSPEVAFRSGLEDSLTLAKALSAHCASVEEFIGLIELALTNDAQMRLLVQQVKQLKR